MCDRVASPFWEIASGGCKAPSRSVSLLGDIASGPQSQARQFDSLSFDGTTHEQENY
ncbi:hypothetical protein LC613_41465 [Nostoc sphaeroides CHAB 2801]|uniref:hypothetical protein n=1 Tax=Nostoc sphaeroides TaxID=446679 RepID=UPI001E45ACF2|nr:hypothetical protein [Nostoc sphaeroides]MCC5633887.1 hypothetical protein [Nostoc sphaeroides CHAB 2801]